MMRQEELKATQTSEAGGGVKGFSAYLCGNNRSTACYCLQCVFICVIPLDPPKPIGEWVKCHM